MATATTTIVFRAKCPCGWKSRTLTDPNGAVAAAQAHIGLDRDRARCPWGSGSRPVLHVRRDGEWTSRGSAT